MGNNILRLAAWRITIRFAASGARGGSSSFSSRVFSVQMRKSEVPMLTTVRNVLLRFLRQFRRIRGKDFMCPGFPTGTKRGRNHKKHKRRKKWSTFLAPLVLLVVPSLFRPIRDALHRRY